MVLGLDVEITGAIVSGIFALVASVLAVVLSAWASRNVRNLRREFQVTLFPGRLEAYKRLWALTEAATPRTVGRPGKDFAFTELRRSLHDWYWKDGNGIFLSAKAQRLHLFALDLIELLQHEVTASVDDRPDSDRARSRQEEIELLDQAVRDALSSLRSELKSDLGVYNYRERWRTLAPAPLEKRQVAKAAKLKVAEAAKDVSPEVADKVV